MKFFQIWAKFLRNISVYNKPGCVPELCGQYCQLFWYPKGFWWECSVQVWIWT